MAELLTRSVAPAVMIPLAAQAFEDVMLNRRFPMMRINLISAVAQYAARKALHGSPDRLPADEALSLAAGKTATAFTTVLREFGSTPGTTEAIVRTAAADLAEVVQEAAAFIRRARDIDTAAEPGGTLYIPTGDLDEAAADLAAALADQTEADLATLRTASHTPINGRHPEDDPDSEPDDADPPTAN
ncbi:hypothetical protein [Actinomadura rayongensis]|uniref:Uncharacterized protein n=1 Tax=Actinomadura rayongensis TaxID=1429076 RepID=A0A6I4WKV4_9ACTN|nr:hypothetical protein [Actinomadura rayongensis]MXQ68346.1 hypothetical protein [Actinomadura rayongensis]